MTLSSLTLIMVSDGPHGLQETKTITTPLTEQGLLRAGLLLISGDADDQGRRVIALRASAP
jgi:hypothetical protein